MRRFFAAVCLAAAVLGSPACASTGPTRAQSLEITPLSIRTATGEHAYRVELADSDVERETGLMFRTELARDAGMLFVYPQDQFIGLWMRNTLIPLDMVFIRADGTVSSVAKGAVPHDETPIVSKEPLRAVLELAAGEADRIGVKPGDRVLHAAFGTAP